MRQAPYFKSTAILALLWLLWTAFNGAAAAPLIEEIALPGNLSAPNSIAVDASGNVWFAEKLGKNIGMYDPAKKDFKSFAIPASWGNVGPSRIALGPQGRIWVTVRRWAESLDNTDFLGEFSPSGASFTRHDLSAKLGAKDLLVDQNRVIPEDLLVDGNGIVWLLVPGENALYRYDPSMGVSKGYAIPSPNCYPRGMTIDGKGAIWFGEANANKLAKFDPKSLTFKEYDIPSAFAGIGEIAADGAGRIWFVEMRNNRLGVFYPDAERFDEAMLPAARSLPSALAVDDKGIVWFLEYLENKVGAFDPKEALFKEYIIPTSSSLPGGIAIDSSRSLLWFTESNTEAKRLGVLDISGASKGQDMPQSMQQQAMTKAGAKTVQAEKNAFGKGGYLGLMIILGLLLAAAMALFFIIMKRTS